MRNEILFSCLTSPCVTIDISMQETAGSKLFFGFTYQEVFADACARRFIQRAFVSGVCVTYSFAFLNRFHGKKWRYWIISLLCWNFRSCVLLKCLAGRLFMTEPTVHAQDEMKARHASGNFTARRLLFHRSGDLMEFTVRAMNFFWFLKYQLCRRCLGYNSCWQIKAEANE